MHPQKFKIFTIEYRNLTPRYHPKNDYRNTSLKINVQLHSLQYYLNTKNMETFQVPNKWIKMKHMNIYRRKLINNIMKPCPFQQGN